MAQQTINVGAVPEDHTGDPARTAWLKANGNFDELYARPAAPDVGNLTAVWNNITTTFTAFKMAITNTASAVGSFVLDFRIGGQSVVSHTTAQNGTFTIRAQPPHGQAFSVTPRSDVNGGCVIVSNGFNVDNTIGIGAGSPTTNIVGLSSVASGTTRALKVTPGVLNLPPITAPSAPQNGDIWTDATGLFVRIAGVTYKATLTAV